MTIQQPTGKWGFISFAILAALGMPARGQTDIVYPPNSGVFNVVTDGGVDNTGRTDVTATLQKILSDRPRVIQVVYFPRGTYLVSGMLKMKIDISRSPASHSHGPWLVGESKEGTVIRLADGTWPKPLYELKADEKGRLPKRLEEQVVLSTGDCTNTTFNKIIRNLTIRVGRNNAGAIGVQYDTSNTGCLGDVNIVSEDGQGFIGLALAGVENGPGQIRHIAIQGFDVGLYSVTDYVIACSDVMIDGPRTLGILNCGITAGEDFVIRMASPDAPAIHNVRNGAIALIGGTFTGKAGGQPAILNEGSAYLRDIRTSGYARAISSPAEKQAAPQDAILAEYWTGTPAGLFFNAKTALCLPIKKTPVVPYEKGFAKWASPMDYGAAGDGKADDTEAVLKALTAPGKTHVVLPYGKTFHVTESLSLGPDVVRVVGTQGLISSLPKDKLTVTIGDGASPVVVLEGISQIPPILVRTGRTVVLDSVNPRYRLPEPWPRPMPREYRPVGFHLEGTGDVFINNTGAALVVDNPKQRVWVRHYNNEWGTEQRTVVDRSPVVVKAGTVWMLGWKSEGLARRVMVEKDGVMELIGFNNYRVGKTQEDGDWPIFEVIDGRFSCDLLVQRGAQANRNLVWETRGGQKRILDIQGNPDGRNCPLYTGYAAGPGSR